MEKYQRFKFFRQFDSIDCGPACIQMLAWFYGKAYPLIYLRNLSCLSREGVSVAGIREGLKTIGFYTRSFQISVKELREFCPLPAVLHWNQNHFVVLYKISENRWNHKTCFCIFVA